MFAQTIPTEAQIRQELASRDIDQEELNRRLLAEGINLAAASPEELLQLRPRVEAIVVEMEAEKVAAEKAAREAEAESAQEISEAVEDGASVEETITEVTTEAANEDLTRSNIYGHQLFRNKSIDVFRSSDNVIPPDTYPLKPGDEIAISIFGASQSDFILTVNENGFIRLPNGLRMPVAGIPLGEARLLIANRLKQYYTFRDGQLNIRIQAARTITVNIFGEVENNGSFTLSSVNTAFNALVAAGGPNARGTVRNIQLINGKDRKEIDVYEFLKSPTQETEFFLSNNATIYVPAAKKVVRLEGGVERPLRYELKEGETLSDLLDFAGGTTTRAETNSIRITRYVNSQLELLTVDLSKQPNFALKNDDLVSVPVIENPIENFVSIEGAVFLPGKYPFTEGVTLGDLVKQARIRPGARRDVGFLMRRNPDGTQQLQRVDLGADAGAMDMLLSKGDELSILTQGRFIDQGSIRISGAIRDEERAIPFPLDGGLTLEEAILLAGGVKANARNEASIIRTPLNNQEEREYLRIPLADAANLQLAPGDQITIYNQERFAEPFTVKISGAVREAGQYRYDPSLGLADLFTLAGGLKIQAARNKIDVFRLQITQNEPTQTLTTTLEIDDNYNIVSSSSPDFELRPYDILVVRQAPEFELIQTVFVDGEVRYPGEYALDGDNLKLTDLIKKAGGLTREAFPPGSTLYREQDGIGNVVIHLDDAMKNPAVVTNVTLKEGDILTIPKARDLVAIRTANTSAREIYIDSILTDQNINVAFDGKESARWYIQNYAAGYDDNAWKRTTTVQYPNGEIKSTKRFLFFKKYPEVLPGSIVTVGAKPPRKKRVEKEEKKPVDWGQVAKETIGVVTSALTLILLLDRVNN
ncbi:SLBB domain-containing protein [Neolewinella agarilytica]|uniref:SLBB domain-containing protein n=1 Tax=Neolewinella agarilytica TaxID=478744 RepID=UPI0023538EE6|nr:SLBB domain-containing protein [Neolewinella agarilytica]